MKNLTSLLLLLTAAFLFSSFSTVTTVSKRQQINPILGDKSFVIKFGHLPDATTNEDLRIQTHLAYVEKLLRKRDVSDLTEVEQQKRNYLLNLLHDYWTAGIFPRNYDIEGERKPCFIDRNGTICAVGYLVDQTMGRHVAEQINSQHKYEKIYEMNDSAVDNWIAQSGLTKEECAMIQPTYGPPPVYTDNYISPEYGLTSSVLTGVNLSFNTINGVQISKGAKSNIVSIVGLLTGAGQVALGIGNFPSEDLSGMYVTTNESQKVLSMVNIGFGTATMILSTWNLIANRKPKSNSTSWNFYNFQTPDNKAGVAFALTKRF